MQTSFRLLLLASAAANVVLGVAWMSGRASSPPWETHRNAAPADIARDRRLPEQTAIAPARSGEPASFWSTLDSKDVGEFASRLKAAGVSPRLVFLLVQQRVRDRYADRLRSFAAPNFDYWRDATLQNDLDSAQLRGKLAVEREIFEEVKSLLGPEGFVTTAQRTALRARYGNLGEDKLAALEAVERDYSDFSAQLARRRMGASLPSDREQRALLDAERRRDLESILSPEELREHDLRASPSASLVKTRARFFDLTEDEFRGLVALQLDFDARFGGHRRSPAQEDEMKLAEPELTAQFESLLGPERFADFKVKSDPTYAVTLGFVTRFQLPPETAGEIVTLRRALMERADAIRANQQISPEQRALELQALTTAAQHTLSQRMNPEALQTYTRSNGQWVTRLSLATP